MHRLIFAEGLARVYGDWREAQRAPGTAETFAAQRPGDLVTALWARDLAQDTPS